MKNLSILFVFMVWGNILAAQTTEEFDYFQKEETGFNNPVNKDSITESKTRFGIMTGTGIGMFTGRNTFSSTFIAPHLSYRLSSRLNINAAAVLGNTQFLSGFEKNSNRPGTFNSKSLMLGMDYKIGKNFSIGAAIQMSDGLNSFQNQPGFGRPFAPGFSPFMTW